MSRQRRKELMKKRVLDRVAKANAEGKLKPGNYYEIPVRHDVWCYLLTGKGQCNCNPVVGSPERYVPPEEN